MTATLERDERTVLVDGLGKRVNGGGCRLDWSDAGFAIPTDPAFLDPEPLPPLGPEGYAGDTVHGARCTASAKWGIRWSTVPCVRFELRTIRFNNAAIKEFALENGMPIILATSKDDLTIRFFLGNEKFLNENEVNKFGYYKLRVELCQHVKRVTADGQEQPNPASAVGRIEESKRKDTGRKWLPLMKHLQHIDETVGPVFVDPRSTTLVPGGVKAGVLYTRTKLLDIVPEDEFQRTRGRFGDVVEGRRRRQAGDVLLKDGSALEPLMV